MGGVGREVYAGFGRGVGTLRGASGEQGGSFFGGRSTERPYGGGVGSEVYAGFGHKVVAGSPGMLAGSVLMGFGGV